MEVMWKVVLAVCLLCRGSEGKLSCRNKAAAVDWYILYKEPGSFHSIYIDSSMTNGFKKSSKDINHLGGALAKTLEPIFSDTPSCGYIAYSDQPPPGKPSAKRGCGHSKGVVMVDEDAVVWLRHSTPRFPKTRTRNNFFPSSAETSAQTFICVTFPVSELKKIEKHLRHIRAHIFDSANTDEFSVDIKNFYNVWTSDEDLNKKEKLYQDFTSMDNEEFKCFFKKTSSKAKVGDLYVTIANTLKTSLYAQTWGGQPDRSDPYCPVEGHHVYNVDSIKSDLLDTKWKRGSDQSKWCVSEDDNWTCIADSNRAVSQFERPGGALCIQNNTVNKAFTMLRHKHEECRKGGGTRIIDSDSVDAPKKKP